MVRVIQGAIGMGGWMNGWMRVERFERRWVRDRHNFVIDTQRDLAN